MNEATPGAAAAHGVPAGGAPPRAGSQQWVPAGGTLCRTPSPRMGPRPMHGAVGLKQGDNRHNVITHSGNGGSLGPNFAPQRKTPSQSLLHRGTTRAPYREVLEAHKLVVIAACASEVHCPTMATLHPTGLVQDVLPNRGSWSALQARHRSQHPQATLSTPTV